MKLWSRIAGGIQPRVRPGFVVSGQRHPAGAGTSMTRGLLSSNLDWYGRLEMKPKRQTRRRKKTAHRESYSAKARLQLAIDTALIFLAEVLAYERVRLAFKPELGFGWAVESLGERVWQAVPQVGIDENAAKLFDTVRTIDQLRWHHPGKALENLFKAKKKLVEKMADSIVGGFGVVQANLVVRRVNYHWAKQSVTESFEMGDPEVFDRYKALQIANRSERAAFERLAEKRRRRREADLVKKGDPNGGKRTSRPMYQTRVEQRKAIAKRMGVEEDTVRRLEGAKAKDRKGGLESQLDTRAFKSAGEMRPIPELRGLAGLALSRDCCAGVRENGPHSSECLTGPSWAMLSKLLR